MNKEITLSDLLRIEDSEKILEICCPDTGIPLWSTIRLPFLRLIMGDLLYATPIVNRGAALHSGSRLRQMAMVSRSFAHNAVRLKALNQQYPVVLMATGARLIERDGCYFNCLSDHFVAVASKRTLVIEDLFGWKWPFPRHQNNVLLQTPLRVGGVLMGRLRARLYRESAHAFVNLASSRSLDLLGCKMDERRREWLTKICMNGAASLLPRYRGYQTIFQKAGARLLIKEEGCYGGPDNASAILAAKHLGMVTAEYQHGAVSSGHTAYNFAPAVSGSHAYRQTLPDFFLTYGSWWGEQVNAPVKKIAIGNPHLAETLGVATALQPQAGRILVLGDGIETSLYLGLCERLVALLCNTHEVVFRPHPLERSSVWTKYPDGLLGKVRIDTHQDIYSSLRESGAVVSEVSTGMFEAVGLTPKVFIWDTPKSRFSIPEHPFQRFSNADELAHLVRDESAGRVSVQQLEKVWAPNWQRNYLEFIEQMVPQ